MVRLSVVIAACLVASACSQQAEPPKPAPKVHIDNMMKLSLDELRRYDGECKQFGHPGDPRVPYFEQDCAKVGSLINSYSMMHPQSKS